MQLKESISASLELSGEELQCVQQWLVFAATQHGDPVAARMCQAMGLPHSAAPVTFPRRGQPPLYELPRAGQPVDPGGDLQGTPIAGSYQTTAPPVPVEDPPGMQFRYAADTALGQLERMSVGAFDGKPNLVKPTVSAAAQTAPIDGLYVRQEGSPTPLSRPVDPEAARAAEAATLSSTWGNK